MAVALAALAGSDTPEVKAGSSEVLSRVTECRRISNPQARLECFDAAAAGLADAQARQGLVVVDREEVRRTRRSLFGFTLPRLALLGNDREEEGREPEEVRTLQTTLTSATPVGHGFWTLVLAEGGTWRTTETSRHIEPEPGQTVVVKRGPLGGYMANLDGAKAVRVRRTD